MVMYPLHKCMLLVLPAAILVPVLLCAQSASDSQEVRPTVSPTVEPSQAVTQGSGSSAALEDSKGAEPIHKEKAHAPLEGNHQGRVWVKVLISVTGDVKKTEVISGDPVLAQAAEEAAKKWKFKPFIKNGRPTEVSVQIPFDFAFADRVRDYPEKSDGSGATAPVPVSVPAAVMAGCIVHQVVPVYPYEAKVRGIEGTVILRAKIGKDGLIHDLKLVSGPAELQKAAMGAVEQWRYKPYVLNGEPVEVDTNITVHFTLGR
jgi:TonB family protein